MASYQLKLDIVNPQFKIKRKCKEEIEKCSK